MPSEAPGDKVEELRVAAANRKPSANLHMLATALQVIQHTMLCGAGRTWSANEKQQFNLLLDRHIKALKGDTE